eukprot:SAG31_NODE_889_length_11203_cov_7.409042_2_plen_64_part_00
MSIDSRYTRGTAVRVGTYYLIIIILNVQLYLSIGTYVNTIYSITSIRVARVYRYIDRYSCTST